MTRSAGAFALGLAVFLSPAAVGQEATPQQAAAPQAGWGDNEPALAAWRLFGEGKTVAAREAAEALRRESPGSYEAHYLLGLALHLEGNLPAALHHLREARDTFERRFGERPTAETPYQWHFGILVELANVAGEMDLYEESVAVTDARNAAYQPPAPAENSWRLMRLGRLEEARAAASLGIASKDPSQAGYGHATLCAIDFDTADRQRAYDTCQQALAHERAQAIVGTHAFTNAGGAARSLFRADEAERLWLEGTRHFQAGNPAQPWLEVFGLYTDQGRLAEAAAAAREMVAWRAAHPAYLDEQMRARGESAAVAFFLVLGRGADAVRIMDRTRGRLDRTGFTSTTLGEREAGAALLDRAATVLLAEQRREEAAWSSGWTSLRATAAAAGLWLRAWGAGREAASRIVDEQKLVSSLRPYRTGAIEVPPWIVGDLAEVLGTGVVATALEQARRQEQVREAHPYLDATAAEIAFRRGRWTEAAALAESALRGLPRAEALVRARAAAVGGHAAWEAGEAARAASLFTEALERDPGVLRRLRLALPVEVAAGEEEVAREAADRLRRSPRFRPASGMFRVTVEGNASWGKACLAGPSGEVRACAEAAAREGEDASAVAARLCAELHASAFAPRVDLSQADLRLLDGAAVADRHRAARRLQGVVEILAGGAGQPAP